jgi:hypothetical protein
MQNKKKKKKKKKGKKQLSSSTVMHERHIYKQIYALQILYTLQK